MRTARAKVVNGKIVTRAKFPEGTKLVLVVDEPRPPPPLVVGAEDEQAFEEAAAAIRDGKTIPIDAVREILRVLTPGCEATPVAASTCCGAPGTWSSTSWTRRGARSPSSGCATCAAARWRGRVAGSAAPGPVRRCGRS